MQIAFRRIAAAVALTLAVPAYAQFAPAGSTISGTVGAQTLSANTGTINSGGAISITTNGANGVALSMTGASTLVNNGTIQTTGNGRAIDSNSGIASLNIINTGLISSVSSDAFRVNTNSSVSLTNSGTIRVTNGGQAIDWAAITSASNTLINQLGGVITAVGEDAVRPGTNGIVINAGTISATPTGSASPTGSDGIDLRTFTGIQVTNTGLISGRHGIATDGANAGPSTLTVTNNTGGTPPRQNSCRPDMISNLGAIRMKDGSVRRIIQEQSGGAVVAAGERQCWLGVKRDRRFGANIGAVA